MEWRVGVLRAGVENVDWTDGGDAPSWTIARALALDAMRALVDSEAVRQEYWMRVGDIPVLVWPGLSPDGRLDLSGISAALPYDRDDPTAT